MKPARRISGTSAPKFPSRCISAHIHAYLSGMCPVSPLIKALQIGLIQPRGSRMTSLIAMQKVEGSNPFSRFFANALHVGGSGSARDAETRWNHPRISPLFRALMRVSAWNGPDAQRLAVIPPCIDPAAAVTGGGRGTLALWPRSESPSTRTGCGACPASATPRHRQRGTRPACRWRRYRRVAGRLPLPGTRGRPRRSNTPQPLRRSASWQW